MWLALRGAALVIGIAALIMVLVVLALTGGWLIGWTGGEIAKVAIVGGVTWSSVAADFAQALSTPAGQAQALLSEASRLLFGRS